VSSQRPTVITSLAGEALKDGGSPERFMKALHTAFVVLNGGRQTGRVALTTIHQVLATAPPGAASYSSNDFRVDLQWLHASGVTTTSAGLRMTLEVASAGNSAFAIFGPEGDLVNVGSVSFAMVGDGHA
jgi:hypothetical protein